MTYLNLASGTDLRPSPWVNLDCVARWPGTARGCDVLWDARKDRIPFDDNSVDGVYAGYLLLHLQQRFHRPLLADIRRVVKPGVPIVFGEIDYEILTARWLADPSSPYLIGLMFGEQGSEHGEELENFDKHCTGFTEKSLIHALVTAGFQRPERVRVHSEVFYELSIKVVK